MSKAMMPMFDGNGNFVAVVPTYDDFKPKETQKERSLAWWKREIIARELQNLSRKTCLACDWKETKKRGKSSALSSSQRVKVDEPKPTEQQHLSKIDTKTAAEKCCELKVRKFNGRNLSYYFLFCMNDQILDYSLL